MKDENIEQLILGARIGLASMPAYIEFLEGFEGTAADLQRKMNKSKNTVASSIEKLRKAGVIRISRWVDKQSPIHTLGNGEDAPRPGTSRRDEAINTIVKNHVTKKEEKEASHRAFLAELDDEDEKEEELPGSERTKHGVRRTSGHITIHRMR